MVFSKMGYRYAIVTLSIDDGLTLYDKNDNEAYEDLVITGISEIDISTSNQGTGETDLCGLTAYEQCSYAKISYSKHDDHR